MVSIEFDAVMTESEKKSRERIIFRAHANGARLEMTASVMSTTVGSRRKAYIA